MRPVRPGLEFGMELAGDIPVMAAEFDHFDDPVVRGSAGEQNTVTFKPFAIIIIDFITVTMPLVNQVLTVSGVCL